MAVIELTTVRCKTCGTVLDEAIRSAVNGVVICPSCTHVWTVARKEATSETLGFLQIGEHDLDVGKYDDAFVAYQKAAELDPKEPEAYFGMALAEFKIRYLKDHTANRLQPICGEITDKKFKDGNSYLRALLNATDAQRSEYEKRAEEIDYILGEFYKLKQAGKRYDCFICVKVTDDETKLPTEDSKDADYIYRLLQEKGFTPFYSERELRNETGADYEARILYALHTAECMLVVCRNADYLQTPWVKNEYTRFLKLVNDEEKESDSITIVFNGKPIEKLPGRAGKIQGVNFVLREADEKVVNFVDLHTPEHRKKIEAERQARIKAEEERQVELDELKRQIEEMRQQAAVANQSTVSQPNSSRPQGVPEGRTRKNKIVALLLCYFFGFFGAHKFYEGKTGLGILYLFTFGLFYIGWFVDLIRIIVKPHIEYYVVQKVKR